MTIDWTADDAREAEAGPETDRRCARVIGWTTEAGTPIRDGDDVAPSQRVSRTPEGAHRAREWLREQGFYVLSDESSNSRSSPGGRTYVWRAMIESMPTNRTVGLAKAHTEHLATARLVLLLAAEGVIPVDEEGPQV